MKVGLVSPWESRRGESCSVMGCELSVSSQEAKCFSVLMEVIRISLINDDDNDSASPTITDLSRGRLVMMAVLNLLSLGMMGMKRTKSPAFSLLKRWMGATKWREWPS